VVAERIVSSKFAVVRVMTLPDMSATLLVG
jgi:hypothetical protein